MAGRPGPLERVIYLPLFGRPEKVTKLFFATDIHGSETCWRKFVNAGAFYEVNTLVLGGDITGKGIQTLTEEKPGAYRTNFLGQDLTADGEEVLNKLELKIRTAGFYPYRATPDEVAKIAASPEYREALFDRLVTESINRWLEIAEAKLKGTGRRIVVTAGNDDPEFINDLFKQSTVVTFAERRIVELDEHHEMINEGFSNPTPWNTHRELPEDGLLAVLTEQIKGLKDVSKAVFNLHVPPYNSKLDEAPELDANLVPKDGGRTYVPVGSTAVRKVIETYQPLLGLHGHVHEAKGSTKIGRTLCLNPGSTYTEGALSGVLVHLGPTAVKSFQPVQG